MRSPYSATPISARFASVRPIEARSVSIPMEAYLQFLDGVERPVEGGEEAEVEELHDGQEAERRSDHPGQEASTGAGQDEGQRDDDDAFERQPHERSGG